MSESLNYLNNNPANTYLAILIIALNFLLEFSNLWSFPKVKTELCYFFFIALKSKLIISSHI